MTQTAPIVSIIIPTRFGNAYITNALMSIKNQTYTNYEIIVIADYNISIPKEQEVYNQTVDIIGSNFSELNVVIKNGPAKGPGIARNLGVSIAQGTYIAFLDDDDKWDDTSKLQKQIAHLDTDANIHIVGVEETHMVTEEKKPIKTILQPTEPNEVFKQMLLRNPLMLSGVLMRKDIFSNASGFKSMYLAEDYELWLRLGKTKCIANTPHTSIEYTVRPGSASNKKAIRMAWTVLVLNIRFLPYYPNRILSIIKSKLRILKAIYSKF